MVGRQSGPYDRFVTQTARMVAPGSGGAAAGPPAGQRSRLPRGQLLAAGGASWYAALPARRREIAQDSALALALAALSLLSLLPYQSQLHPRWEAFALVGAQCLPLALRRVWPVPVLICSGVLRDLYDGLKFGFAPLPLAPAIAFATVADRSRPAIRWITVVATVGGVAYSQTLPGHNEPYDSIVQASIFGAAWVIGTLNRHRRAALAAAASRADRAEASLDVAAASAAAAERVRIARELHDVVAHHVSLIAVQAEAVGALLPARPAEASRSADAIAATARQAMTELRRLLGVLRISPADQPHSPERSRLTPVPSMSRLNELLASVRGAGLPVTCEVSGPEAALPPGVDLTAYRIIQEALTNALRHAPGSPATVTVTYAPANLSVEVTNAPAPPATSATQATSTTPATPATAATPTTSATLAAPTTAATADTPVTPAASAPLTTSVPPATLAGGYGLAGIAERVASCGGSLALGPSPDGGFTVTARLPLT
jgi:signal transduction histidine kinase